MTSFLHREPTATAVLALPPASDEVIPYVIGFSILAVIYSAFGFVCAALAPGRGRSPVGWFFIGAGTQCIGIVLVLALPNLKLEEEKRRRQEEETRRLREQLKKERQVADERHIAHRDRLGTHDRALGMDTSAAEQRLLGGESAGGGAPPPVPGQLAAPAEPMWFYARDNQQQGPVPQSRLAAMQRDGRIDVRTLVWREGMADWVALGDLPEIFGGAA